MLEGNGTNMIPDSYMRYDEYQEGDYAYVLGLNTGGWDVWKVLDKTKTSYGPIISEIGGVTIEGINSLFSDCTSLVTAPTIPSGVTNMQNTFSGCTSLATAPEIPSGVTNMRYTFDNCTLLKGQKIIIPSAVTNFSENSGDWDNGPSWLKQGSTIIPDGAKYTKADGTVLEGNGFNAFPSTVSTLDQYEEYFYIYTYNKGLLSTEGDYGAEWSVVVPDNKWNGIYPPKSNREYEPIRSEIAGKPVTNMCNAFRNCDQLTTVPTIPNSVTNMEYAFDGCFNIKVAPTIPNGVTYMFGAFRECHMLQDQTITIPSTVTDPSGTSGSWSNGPSWIKQ